MTLMNVVYEIEEGRERYAANSGRRNAFHG
jgi:hypothetical protein